MLSHRQPSVNHPHGDDTDDEPAIDDDDEQHLLTGAITVSVDKGEENSNHRRRAAAATTSSSTTHRIPIDYGVRSSINTYSHHTPAYSSRDGRFLGALDRPSTCCCLTFATTPTRKLHLAFCKALAITIGCLVAIFLLGVILEPLILTQDGWLDCADPDCTHLVPRPTASFMHLEVHPEESLLISAYHRTDTSEKHAISNPDFFNEWHERTVLDYLDAQKLRIQHLTQFIQPDDVSDGIRPNIQTTLYQHGASIHADVGRTREIFDSEKLQLEKAYMNLIPWLPHHMRLGEAAEKNSPNLVPTKTTHPLLMRSMLDATTSYLTNTYPGCMWIRLWIVDSTIYVHSFNTRKVVHYRPGPDGLPTTIETNSPTNIFGSESSRLNHFLMMILNVVSTSLSQRLNQDAAFQDLPKQPQAATGREDHFPNLDAIFMLGDLPCEDLHHLKLEYEKYEAELRRVNKIEIDLELARMKERLSISKLAKESLQAQSPTAAHTTPPINLLSLDETLSVSSDSSAVLRGDPGLRDPYVPPPVIVGGDNIIGETVITPHDATTPETHEEVNSLYHSILSFQNGYQDENTRELLLFPRTIDTELTRREKIAGEIRRGNYPIPSDTFAPIFVMRQSVAETLPPPPMPIIDPTAQSQTRSSSPAYNLWNHLWNVYQFMEQSPKLLIPDFTRWNALVLMEEEDKTSSVSLVPPKTPGQEDQQTIKEEGGLEEDASDVKGADDGANTPKDELPTLHAIKLHQLHNKQIAHLRETRKLMIILQPLQTGGDAASRADSYHRQVQDQRDELELEHLSTINVNDINNMDSSNEPAAASGGAPHKPLTLQQKMLRKLHVLLKHRLIHSWDHHANMTLADKHKNKLDGEGLLQDLMALLNDHYSSYSSLEETRAFQEKYGTGFKVYNEESVVPTSCHLPFVIYEEAAVDDFVRRKDGKTFSASNLNGAAGPGAGSTVSGNVDNSLHPQPGSWAHWLYTCDYLVLREVKPVAQSNSPFSASTTPSTTDSQLPPLILPASNSFDEYWSVTYEPYKHYLPFTLSMSLDDVASVATEEELKTETQFHELYKVSPPKPGAPLTSSIHHPILTQLRSSLRTKLLQATLPNAFSTQSSILHLLPLLHQLFATDWTLRLSDLSSHKHEVRNALAGKKGLHEEGTDHEDAARATITTDPTASSSTANLAEDTSNPLHAQHTWEARHSCSSNFATLSDALSCLWCVRVSSRHWMRTVMSPEYIASYMRKLFTLYSHTLKDRPLQAEFVDDDDLRRKMTKIKTQTDVREWIKQVVFSTQGMDE